MDEYKRFNTALKEFITCTIEAFPHIKELSMLETAYKFFKAVGKKNPCKVFQSITSSCQHAIMSKDIEYFMENSVEYPDIMNGLSSVITREWQTLKPEEKDAVFQHLQVLVILSNKCVS
jgi:hypothetical protein